MEQDILAYHIYSQTDLDLNSKNKENVALLAKSFGMEMPDVVEVLNHILSKKTGSALRRDFKTAIEDKMTLLERHKVNEKNRKDFVINVLGPYLNLLSRNELQNVGLESFDFQNRICKLFGKFFPNKIHNALDLFIGNVRFYFDGGSSSVKFLHILNETMMPQDYYVDFSFRSSANILIVKEEILPETCYGKSSIRILNLKRIMPGLLLPKTGYFTIGSNTVILLDDMIAIEAEELMTEMKTKGFEKYTDVRFTKYWRSIGLNLDVSKASQSYMGLIRRDLEGKKFAYIKTSLQMDVAIHEAKHLADNIEHPELTLNIDCEFSAHMTQAYFSPIPYVALFSVINRMQQYAMFHKVSALNDVTRRLWRMAIRSAEDSNYSIQSLRSDLMNLYLDFRTIREYAKFEPLDDFGKIVEKMKFGK